MNQLVALSPAAYAQLGADSAVPLAVRVRRVNPQEYERALLRTGQRAPERLAAPKPLLAVLRRRLAGEPVPERLPPEPQTAAVTPARAIETPKPPPARPAVRKQPPARSDGSYTVQVAAFSSKANAEATARKLGGAAAPAGAVWRVRLGPFATRSEADASLARAKRAGFADARIVTSR